MLYNFSNSSDSVRSSGKSGMSIDNAIRVIANAKTASLNDITCSNFIWGVNTPGVVILSVPYCFGLTPLLLLLSLVEKTLERFIYFLCGHEK
jgi:hypothetical protein